jgi:hypothetical protein
MVSVGHPGNFPENGITNYVALRKLVSLTFNMVFRLNDPTLKNLLEYLARCPLKFPPHGVKQLVWRIKFKTENFRCDVSGDERVGRDEIGQYSESRVK